MLFSKKPKLDTLQWDVSTWELAEQSQSHKMWVTQTRDAIRLQFTNDHPNFGYDLTDLDAANQFYRKQSSEFGGAMISVKFDSSDSLQFLQGVFKYRSPEPNSLAMYFVGILVFPFDSFLYQINTESLEVGTTGVREAAVMAMGDGPPIPDEEPEVIESMDDLFAKSRKSELKRISADDPKYDGSFPDHPLSKVRNLQSHIVETLSFPGWLPKQKPYRIGT